MAASLLLVLSGPLLCIAGAVGLSMGRPVFFRQARAGLHGKPFTLWKFRTMKNAVDANGHPLPDEARLTRFGKFLRATSLDELPELWNVVKGEMSLIGPRPLLIDYLPYYSPAQAQRHTVRPGLTGLAQVSGRNALEWEKRLELDATYAQSVSLLLDGKIILRTLGTIVSAQGISAEGHATMPRFDDEVKARRRVADNPETTAQTESRGGEPNQETRPI